MSKGTVIMLNEKVKHIPPSGMIGPRIMCLSKYLRKVFNEAMAQEGLFSGQEDILLYLELQEGLSLIELAKELGVAPATASISVKRMEKSGFIEKKPDETDARITRLYLTEKGRRAPENIRKKMDALEAILTETMSREESELITSLLDKTIENFKNKGEKNDA